MGDSRGAALSVDSFRSEDKDPQKKTKQKRVGRCPRGIAEEKSSCYGGLLALMHGIEFQVYLLRDSAAEVQDVGQAKAQIQPKQIMTFMWLQLTHL